VLAGHDGSAELVTTNQYSRQTITYVISSTASRNLLSMTKWIRTELQRLAGFTCLPISVCRKVTRSYKKHKMNAISRSSAQSAVNRVRSQCYGTSARGQLVYVLVCEKGGYHSAGISRKRIRLQQCHLHFYPPPPKKVLAFIPVINFFSPSFMTTEVLNIRHG
jgi:hypothetical protein